MRRLVVRAPIWLLAPVLIGACGKATTNSDPIASGRQAYIANCASCHNLDPTIDGLIGPAVVGSSRDLLEARVLHQAYPPGYRPKRSTHLMQTMPWVAPKLDDIAAFLAAPRTSK
jgi:mono/diheme cytochrome c family protein